MKTLMELAQILRSKNAGPLYVTLDVIFSDRKTLDAVAASGALTPGRIAALYGTEEAEVQLIYYEIVNALKITLPRKLVSGEPGDSDIYGCQQHMPLSRLPIPIETEDLL